VCVVPYHFPFVGFSTRGVLPLHNVLQNQCSFKETTANGLFIRRLYDEDDDACLNTQQLNLVMIELYRVNVISIDRPLISTFI
jgi:hypothetical protein